MTSAATLHIDRAGVIRFIYRDDLAELIDHGPATTRRASHVEPAAGGGWSADLAPSGGPVLGPFRLRADALAAELAWLDARL